MSHTGLKLIRSDSREDVFTEHTDHIRPSELSKSLLDKHGQNGFKVSLRRNVYIIYIKREKDDQQLHTADDVTSSETTRDPATGRELSDVVIARNALLGKLC